jgi:hypothetical protein
MIYLSQAFSQAASKIGKAGCVGGAFTTTTARRCGTMKSECETAQPDLAGVMEQVENEERLEEDFEATILWLDAATIERLLEQIRE